MVWSVWLVFWKLGGDLLFWEKSLIWLFLAFFGFFSLFLEGKTKVGCCFGGQVQVIEERLFGKKQAQPLGKTRRLWTEEIFHILGSRLETTD